MVKAAGLKLELPVVGGKPVLVPGINGDIRTTLFDSHIKIGTENVETINFDTVLKI